MQPVAASLRNAREHLSLAALLSKEYPRILARAMLHQKRLSHITGHLSFLTALPHIPATVIVKTRNSPEHFECPLNLPYHLWFENHSGVHR